jgi:hypothetical protein
MCVRRVSGKQTEALSPPWRRDQREEYNFHEKKTRVAFTFTEKIAVEALWMSASILHEFYMPTRRLNLSASVLLSILDVRNHECLQNSLSVGYAYAEIP